MSNWGEISRSPTRGSFRRGEGLGREAASNSRLFPSVREEGPSRGQPRPFGRGASDRISGGMPNGGHQENIWGAGAGAGLDAWGGQDDREEDGLGGRQYENRRPEHGRGGSDRYGNGDFPNGRYRDDGRGEGWGDYRGGGDWNDAAPRDPNYIPREEDLGVLYGSGISSGINFSKYQDVKCRVTGENPPAPMDSFAASGLRNILLENVRRCKYETPTPVQR